MLSAIFQYDGKEGRGIVKKQHPTIKHLILILENGVSTPQKSLKASTTRCFSF